MPKMQDDIPRAIRPLVALGLELDHRGDPDRQAPGDCPFCGRQGKFVAACATGQWQCFACAKEGNAISFLRQLWAASDEATNDYEALAADRGLLQWETLLHWGAVQSLITGEWLLPGYSADGRLHQLYRWSRMGDGKGGWRRAFLPLPGLWEDGKVHAMFRPKQIPRQYSTIYWAEGPWDGMVLWETLRYAKDLGDGGVDRTEETSLVPTGSVEDSLLADALVLATPSANIWQDPWMGLCAGKKVVLLYDSDHPIPDRPEGGLAGLRGMRKVATKLCAAAEPPESIHWLAWGPKGYDPSKKSGYDIRDWLTAETPE